MNTEQDDSSTNHNAPLYLNEKSIQLKYDKKIFSMCHIPESTRGKTALYVAYTTVYVGTNDGHIILIDTEALVVILESKVHKSRVYSVIYNSNDNRIWSASEDGTICILNAEIQIIKQVSCDSMIKCLLYIADIGSICCLCPFNSSSKLLLWHIDYFSKIVIDEPGNCMTLHNNKIYIGGCNKIYIVDVETFKIQSFQAHKKKINAIVILNDNLWSCSSDKNINVWNLKTNESICLLETQDEVTSLCVVNDNIWSGSFKSIRIWDTNKFVCLERKKCHSDIIRNIILTNNQYIWTGSFDGTINVWRPCASTGEPDRAPTSSKWSEIDLPRGKV